MANIISRAAGAIASLFSRGGGKGSRIASQNRAAKLGKSAANRKAVRLPAMGKKGGRNGAKGSGGGGG
jgi:hypothetical protein